MHRSTIRTVIIGAVVCALSACGSTSHKAAPQSTSNSILPATTRAAATTTTTPANGFAAFLAAHPDAVVHSGPIPYGREAIAILGLEDGAAHRALAIVSIVNGQARQIARLPLPSPEFEFARNRTIQNADITGDGASDALVRFVAADNDPGVVVSADGGTWRLVPASDNANDVYIGRDPTIANSQLTSARNDCIPTCAQGHNTKVIWHYDRRQRQLTFK